MTSLRKRNQSIKDTNQEAYSANQRAGELAQTNEQENRRKPASRQKMHLRAFVGDGFAGIVSFRLEELHFEAFQFEAQVFVSRLLRLHPILQQLYPLVIQLLVAWPDRGRERGVWSIGGKVR